jgi:hypothetical protein
MLITALAFCLGAGLAARALADGPVEKPKQQTEKEKDKEKEKEKKGTRPVKKKPKEGGVYTNTDLGAKTPEPGATPAPSTARSTGRPPASETPSGIDPDTGRPYSEESGKAAAEAAPPLPEPLDEMGWRFQAEARRNTLQAAERKVADIQARLDALMSDLAPTNVMDPNRLQTIEAEKAKARQDLEAAKGELAKAKSSWSDFEETARRKGVPPRWLEPPS